VEAVKPLLAKQKLYLNISDCMVQVWERYYIEATAKIFDEEWKELIYSVGYAREEETKKGMDSSQITWSSSSYARKYALCWLFWIDDWIDSDKTNKGEDKKAEKKEEKDITKEWPFNNEELPWFNDAELEQLKGETEFLKSKSNSDDLIKAISTKYRISKAMKLKIADVWAAVE